VPAKYRDLPSIEVSSADRTTVGTENLQRAIAAAIGQELGPKTNRVIGDGRWRVKSRLRKLQAANDLLMRDKKPPSCPTLTTDQFQGMVSEECANTDDAREPQWLLRYLHDTGVIYHRRDLFSSLVIVEQRWVIDNIYTIFNPGTCRDHLLQSRGRFRASQLNEWAWSEIGFTEEQQRLMVRFMYSCRICFILLKLKRVHMERTST
jgi:internalin A